MQLIKNTNGQELIRQPNSVDPFVSRVGIRCNWGAVFSGVFFTLAMAGTLMMLGNALGLATIRIIDADTTSAARTGVWLYTLASWTIAFACGGGICAQIGKLESTHQRTLHGLTSWAVTGVLLVMLAGQQSFLFRLLLVGDGPVEAHWLMLAVAVCGGIGSAVGGRLGGALMDRVRNKQNVPREKLRVA